MIDVKKVFPRWLKDLKRFQSLKSQFFIYGNVYDCYYFPINYRIAESESDLQYVKFNDLKDLLQDYLFTEGFDMVSYFDIVDGINFASPNGDITNQNVIERLELKNSDSQAYLNNAQAKKLEDAIGFYREMVANTSLLSAGIINFASRFTASPNSLEEEAKLVYLKILKAAQESQSIANKNGRKNQLIFICDKLNDIPAWILLENPLTKGIEIHKPDREERNRFFEKRNKHFYRDGEEVKLIEIGKIFPDLTENFSNRELENLITISKQESIHLNRIKEIIDLFKYGDREDPWQKIDNETVALADTKLRKRVLGQDEAIDKAVMILKRSKIGMDGIDKTRPSNKPKGVLFFAGPTGTGKTELAKSLAELIFSDEDAMIRFDMSEYNDGNSDVKLIGSPPGYVGYEEGGQLTDAVRRKPFSIVLFDEIEKAHPRIFDKFLQILDDGRLTDGKGETVYFSHSLIIFTSNLGIYKEDPHGNRFQHVKYEDNYDTIRQKILEEIRNFFSSTLGRPEIFNRFGDNFVVFDFIRPDVALKIVDMRLKVIQKNLLKNHNIIFHYDEVFMTEFLNLFAMDNLDMGGRGIVNRIETYVKNGLTDHLFKRSSSDNNEITIKIANDKVVFK